MEECKDCEGTGILNSPPYSEEVIYCQSCGGSGFIAWRD